MEAGQRDSEDAGGLEAGPSHRAHPHRVPGLPAKEDTPWNQRRRRILSKYRSRKYRAKKRKTGDQQEHPHPDPLDEDSSSTGEDDEEENDHHNVASVPESLDMFAGCEGPDAALEAGTVPPARTAGRRLEVPWNKQPFQPQADDEGRQEDNTESGDQEEEGSQRLETVWNWDNFQRQAEDDDGGLDSQELLPPGQGGDDDDDDVDEDDDDEEQQEQEEAEEEGGAGGGQQTVGRNLLREELEQFAGAVARLKSTSFISDDALEKTFRLFALHRANLQRLVENGIISCSYKNSVRPYLVKQALPIRGAAKIYKYRDKRVIIERHLNLARIPQELTQLPGNDKLLWMVSQVRVRDVKYHYLDSHLEAGIPLETIRKQFKFLTLSSDGVEEAKKGSRKFHAVTLRIGSDVYILKMFSLLAGVEEAKLSGEEILG